MQDWSGLERFLEESFAEGQQTRELRLSRRELDYLMKYHPQLCCVPAAAEDSGKNWYLISLFGG